jgi:hypothetical protein
MGYRFGEVFEFGDVQYGTTGCILGETIGIQIETDFHGVLHYPSHVMIGNIVMSSIGKADAERSERFGLQQLTYLFGRNHAINLTTDQTFDNRQNGGKQCKTAHQFLAQHRFPCDRNSMVVRFLLFMLVCSIPVAGESIAYTNKLAELQSRLAQSPTNIDLLFQLGDLCHDEGVKDNRKAVVLAETYFKQLLAINTNHARGRVMYGSTLTMKGRDAFWPPTQISWVREGNREMDQAVKLAPDDPKVRFARANNNFYMPKFLGREEIVHADLEWLWTKAKDKSSNLSTEERQNVASLYGQYLKKHKKADDAIEIWKQGIALSPDSPIAREIQSLLEKAR